MTRSEVCRALRLLMAREMGMCRGRWFWLVVAMVFDGCGGATAEQTVGEINALALASARRASLTSGETALLEAIFGDSLDVSRLVLAYDTPLVTGSSRTIENNIYFESGLDLAAEAYRRSPDFAVLLAHEATHVWQYQNIGLRYIPDALFEQGVGIAVHGDRGRAYVYRVGDVDAFGELDTEQQAKLIEEYVGLVLFGRAPRRAEDYDPAAPDAWLSRAERVLSRGVQDHFAPLSLAVFRGHFDGLRR